MKIEQTTGVVMDFILKELKDIMDTLVVKLDYIADKYETKESHMAGDLYSACVLGRDSFGTYMTYSDYALRKCFNSEYEIETYKVDRNKIPVEKRSDVLKYQREYILSTYDETNNYYRMLSGLPNVEDDKFIYVEDDIFGIDKAKPIHLMTEDEIVILNAAGVLTKIIDQNPEKDYLKYLHDRKIPITVARMTPGFNIMYIKKNTVDPSFPATFLRLYNESRTYVLNKIYDDAYKRNSEYYDAFIGIFILCITCQRFIINYFKSGIGRDFYDKDIIKMLFQAYGLPYYNDINLAYLRRVAINLNMLLRYKATDKVFVDIFDLFDLENVEIYKYYLIKDHQKDIYGNPVFSYKQDPITKNIVPDAEKQYSLRFSQIPRKSKNISLDLMDPANYLDYMIVTNDDILWGDDGDKSDFMRKILETEFNYMETKYIAVSSRYELTKLTFELCYFFRLLVDTVPAQKYLELEVRYVKGKCRLFHVIVALFALTCKKLHFDGNLMDTTTKVMSIYGFNFKTDMGYIDKIIEEHKLLEYDKTLDTDTIKLKKNPIVYEKSSDVVNLYLENKRVHDTILKKKYESKTIRDYNAYKKIYDATMVTNYVTDMYRGKDGSLPKTYLEYLKLNSYELYTFVKNTSDENMIESLDAILVALENYFRSDEFNNIFLNIPSLSADNMRKFIYFLIDLFKSYTLDLAAMNVIYHIDNKVIHNLKMIFEDNPTADVEFFQPINFKFIFDIIESNFELSTELKLILKEFIESNMEYYEKFDLKEDITKMTIYELADTIGSDFFDIMYSQIYDTHTESLNLKELCRIEYLIPAFCKLIFKENMFFTKPFEVELDSKIRYKDKDYQNNISYFKSKLLKNYIEILLKQTTIDMKTRTLLKDILNTVEHKTIGESTTIDMYSDLLDNIDVDIEQKDKVRLYDQLTIIRKE